MTERIRELLQRVASAEGSVTERDRELRERLPAGRGIAAVEREVASEIAHSLGRAGQKLQLAIERARATLAGLLASGAGTPERRLLEEQYEDERALAERRLRDLLIQREAIGLRNHRDVHRLYVIPPRVPSE